MGAGVNGEEGPEENGALRDDVFVGGAVVDGSDSVVEGGADLVQRVDAGLQLRDPAEQGVQVLHNRLCLELVQRDLLLVQLLLPQPRQHQREGREAQRHCVGMHYQWLLSLLSQTVEI